MRIISCVVPSNLMVGRWRLQKALHWVKVGLHSPAKIRVEMDTFSPSLDSSKAVFIFLTTARSNSTIRSATVGGVRAGVVLCGRGDLAVVGVPRRAGVPAFVADRRGDGDMVVVLQSKNDKPFGGFPSCSWHSPQVWFFGLDGKHHSIPCCTVVNRTIKGFGAEI